MKVEKRKISWISPSNIALVKYWGKKPVQIPANPSLSMTLNKAYTEMTMDVEPLEGKEEIPHVDFHFEGKKNEKFETKIRDFIRSLFVEFPLLREYHYRISSRNTFPHSTGIASSASSMSALGLCLADLLTNTGEVQPDHEFYRLASRLSRLASGSACRSVYGGYVIWGHMPRYSATSDEYAVPMPFEVNPAMRAMNDAILVVSSREKEVSSRAGHSLMHGHPFADARFESAVKNILALGEALTSGDFDRFIQITESEAMTLHALMMTSNPSFFLFEPNTVNIVKKVRQFRKETSIPVCFTLDAGPNVHMIYPGGNEVQVKKWIREELVDYCENGQWIDDEIGLGPKKIDYEA